MQKRSIPPDFVRRSFETFVLDLENTTCSTFKRTLTAEAAAPEVEIELSTFADRDILNYLERYDLSRNPAVVLEDTSKPSTTMTFCLSVGFEEDNEDDLNFVVLEIFRQFDEMRLEICERLAKRLEFRRHDLNDANIMKFAAGWIHVLHEEYHDTFDEEQHYYVFGQVDVLVDVYNYDDQNQLVEARATIVSTDSNTKIQDIVNIVYEQSTAVLGGYVVSELFSWFEPPPCCHDISVIVPKHRLSQYTSFDAITFVIFARQDPITLK